jgi:hypothetical protein
LSDSLNYDSAKSGQHHNAARYPLLPNATIETTVNNVCNGPSGDLRQINPRGSHVPMCDRMLVVNVV